MAHENSTADFRPERNPVDCLLDVLADEQRRRVLRYFQEVEDPVATVDTLVDHLVDSGHPSDTRAQTATQLHHGTLPKLADAGIIEYDARTHTIRYHASPKWDQVSTTLTELEEVANTSSDVV